jgi:hypothetical protein
LSASQSPVARIGREIVAVGESRAGLARLGVVVCAGLILLVSVSRLFNDALPGQDHWASLNAHATYAERTFPSDAFIGSGHVAEDARLWMPRDTTYRIVVAARYANTPWGYAAPDFLAEFLFPRRRVDSSLSRWVFCIGCVTASLGNDFHVLSDGGNGVLFGRVGT